MVKQLIVFFVIKD